MPLWTTQTNSDTTVCWWQLSQVSTDGGDSVDFQLTAKTDGAVCCSTDTHRGPKVLTSNISSP